METMPPSIPPSRAPFMNWPLLAGAAMVALVALIVGLRVLAHTT